jgi:hypothetical protein
MDLSLAKYPDSHDPKNLLCRGAAADSPKHDKSGSSTGEHVLLVRPCMCVHLMQPKGFLLTDTLMKHVKALELKDVDPTQLGLGYPNRPTEVTFKDYKVLAYRHRRHSWNPKLVCGNSKMPRNYSH